MWPKKCWQSCGEVWGRKIQEKLKKGVCVCCVCVCVVCVCVRVLEMLLLFFPINAHCDFELVCSRLNRDWSMSLVNCSPFPSL